MVDSLSYCACRFTNRDDMDFGMAAEMHPVQEFSLNEDFTGVLEYPLQCVFDAGVSHVGTCSEICRPGHLGC